MKIVTIQQSPDLGGAETFMLSLIKAFKENNNQVSLYTNKGKLFNFAQAQKIDVYQVPFVLDIIGNYKGLVKSILLLPFSFFYYVNLLNNLKNEKTDLILMSGFSEKMLITFVNLYFRIPVFWIEYSQLDQIFKRNFYFPRILYFLLFRFAKKIIVPTNFTKVKLSRSLPGSKNKFVVIPCGISIHKKSHEIPKSLSDKFIIGSVSRLTREKGQDILIKAFPDVLSKIPNAYLIIVGDGPDKKYFNDLVLENKIEKNVRIEGFVDDLSYYYSIFDVFVFPSVWDLEGFGLVIPEAMLYKKPVIASDLSHIGEIVEDGKEGLIFKKGNANDLSSSIITLALDFDRRKMMGNAGEKKVKSNYDIDKISKQYLKIFNEKN